MPDLADVNTLLALVTDRHAQHRTAVRWFEELPPGGAVICRVAQLGLLRLLANPTVMGDEALTERQVWELWHGLAADERVAFTTSEPDGLDSALERFTEGRSFSPRLWTDVYLAATAFAGDLTLVTFDKGFRGFAGLKCVLLGPARSRR